MNELKIMCPEAHIDELSDALDALDALSISVEDADAQTDAEQALFGEPDMPPPKGVGSEVVSLPYLQQKTKQQRPLNCSKRRIF